MQDKVEFSVKMRNILTEVLKSKSPHTIVIKNDVAIFFMKLPNYSIDLASK